MELWEPIVRTYFAVFAYYRSYSSVSMEFILLGDGGIVQEASACVVAVQQNF